MKIRHSARRIDTNACMHVCTTVPGTRQRSQHGVRHPDLIATPATQSMDAIAPLDGERLVTGASRCVALGRRASCNGRTERPDQHPSSLFGLISPCRGRVFAVSLRCHCGVFAGNPVCFIHTFFIHARVGRGLEGARRKPAGWQRTNGAQRHRPKAVSLVSRCPAPFLSLVGGGRSSRAHMIRGHRRKSGPCSSPHRPGGGTHAVEAACRGRQ